MKLSEGNMTQIILLTSHVVSKQWNRPNVHANYCEQLSYTPLSFTFELKNFTLTKGGTSMFR